jgi:tetratricopeptide (TPR) repeat protein
MRLSHFVVALSVAAVVTSPLVAQTSAQKIEAARQLLEASQFDSATTLLQQVIDQDPASKLQAYVWLGIVNHFAGRDSLARAAFREAYTLDPNLQLQGVGELDPERLPAVLTAAKDEATAVAGAPAAPARVDTGAVRSNLPAARCLPGCTGLDRPPEFISMPRVAFPDNLRDAARDLDLVIRFVIGADGRVDAKSIHIVRSNVASMGSEIINGLAHSRFRPGRTAQGPVPTQVEMTFTAKTAGGTGFSGNYVLGPPRRL